ncbi:LacI family DNA-binding transcriptional regulator [Streptomyces sp. NPDC047515]|uniref:LacI family DNA-binding transcriptional regulator n=1 Tax=Streptomyces sp. NPDC047515 TaxID=3155380 RepID=UPI0033EF2958
MRDDRGPPAQDDEEAVRGSHDREVASAAGVSVSTVSRAFTAPDQVQPKTRQRILDAAAARR